MGETVRKNEGLENGMGEDCVALATSKETSVGEGTVLMKEKP